MRLLLSSSGPSKIASPPASSRGFMDRATSASEKYGAICATASIMLSPPGIIEAARAMAASLSRCLEIRCRAASDREISEMPKIATKGRNVSQVATGMWCNARQAVQRASIVPQFPFRARPASAKKYAAAAVTKPTRPTAMTPVAHSFGGIRSQAEAAQSANALHMVME